MKKPILTTIPKLLDVSKTELAYDNIKVPVFQREYSWDIINSQKLLKDLDKLGEDDKHFFGVIIGKKTSNGKLLIIDGQQRILTTALLLKSKNQNCIFDNYLYSSPEIPTVIPSSIDNETFRLIMEDKPDDNISKMRSVYEDFQKTTIKDLDKKIDKLEVVFIELEEGIDNANEIFETINHDGVDLTLADLIRNFLLMELPNQDDLFDQLWEPMLKEFRLFYGGKADNRFNDFITRYIEYQTSEKIRADLRGDAYTQFKALALKMGRENTIEDLYEKSSYYHCYNGKLDEVREQVSGDEDGVIGQYSKNKLSLEQVLALKRLRLLDITQTFSPLIPTFKSNLSELIKICDLFCSYIVRSQVCSGRTGSFGSIFPQMCRKERLSYENMSRYLAKDQDFPSNERFERALMQQPIYNMSRVNEKYILEMLDSNNLDPKENGLVGDSKCTVEHIMPQTIDKKSSDKERRRWARDWIDMLGKEGWEQIHDSLCDTLGNLTITAYNSEYSNRPFHDKLSLTIDGELVGLKGSRFVRLNEDVKNKSKWTEKEILARSKRLTSRALALWRYPLASD